MGQEDQDLMNEVSELSLKLCKVGAVGGFISASFITRQEMADRLEQWLEDGVIE